MQEGELAKDLSRDAIRRGAISSSEGASGAIRDAIRARHQRQSGHLSWLDPIFLDAFDLDDQLATLEQVAMLTLLALGD